MRHSSALLVFFGALMCAQAARAWQGSCPDKGEGVFGELIERWTWESFWEGRTSGFQYKPQAKATVDVFWNANLVGMCSQDLGSCTAYERLGIGLGQSAGAADRTPGADLRQSTEMFLRKLNEPRVISQHHEVDSRLPPDNAGRFEHDGTVVSIPTTPNELVIQRNASGFQSCVLSNQKLPSLGLPKPIQDKITPDNLPAFERWLQGRLHPRAGSKSEYVIPYYAPEDPLIYVLVRVNGATESVIFAVADPSGPGWRLGGHFDPKESPAQVQRLEPLILSARMASVLR